MASPNPYQSPGTEATPVVAESGPVLADVVIEISGHLSLRDFLAAGRLSNSFMRRAITPWLIRPLLKGVALFVAMVVFGMWWFHDSSDQLFEWFLFCLPLILLIVFPSRAFIERRQLRQLARLGMGCFAYTQSHVDNVGIHITNSAITSIMRWEAFSGFRECPDVVVLYYRGFLGEWMVIARAKFKSEGDWQAFRQLVASKLRPI